MVICWVKTNEIDNAIEYIRFGDIDEALNTTCPISHRDFSGNDRVIRLCECRHIFDSASILQWFTRNSLCPLCRNDIRTPAETEINTPKGKCSAEFFQVPFRPEES